MIILTPTNLDILGPFEIGYISRYLDFMTKPLTRIDNLNELIDFIIQNDVTEFKIKNLWNEIRFFQYVFFYLSILLLVTLTFL